MKSSKMGMIGLGMAMVVTRSCGCFSIYVVRPRAPADPLQTIELQRQTDEAKQAAKDAREATTEFHEMMMCMQRPTNQAVAVTQNVNIKVDASAKASASSGTKPSLSAEDKSRLVKQVRAQIQAMETDLIPCRKMNKKAGYVVYDIEPEEQQLILLQQELKRLTTP